MHLIVKMQLLGLLHLYRRSNLWMNTRIYLVNMSVSDIVMCVTAVPVTPYTAFIGNWSFGPAFCRALPLLQVTQTRKINSPVPKRVLPGHSQFSNVVLMRTENRCLFSFHCLYSGIRDLRVEPEPAGHRLGPVHLPPPDLRQDQPRRRALRHPHGRHHRPHLHRHDDALLLEHEVLSL